MAKIIGWDIGGVHTKAVWLPQGNLARAHIESKAFEIWKADDELPSVLSSVYSSLGVGIPDAMAVTMTAELADVFESKHQGVLFVLNALRDTFPDMPIFLLSLDQQFEPLEVAFGNPTDFAAANWLASALFVAERHSSCLLVDVGSTTTDIIPIQEGCVVTKGRTDMERLIAGELVYTGVVRTNPNTIATRVPVRGRPCPVAAEMFALMGDVYLQLGLIAPSDYTVPTPDSGPKTVSGAQRRLARLVCADIETLSPEEIQYLAGYLYEKQVQQVSEAMYQVCSRLPGEDLPLIAVGSGRFLAIQAGQRLGLRPASLEISSEVLSVLPCLAVAALLENHLKNGGI
jgi:probable H4MPT-linked C1 transfer pathway protein